MQKCPSMETVVFDSARGSGVSLRSSKPHFVHSMIFDS